MSFSVDFMSDIHEEWWQRQEMPFDYAARKKNDIVIVAGDLATNTAESMEELKKIAAVYGTVIFLDGNHEYRTGAPDYKYNFDFDAVEKQMRDAMAEMPNVHYLGNGPFIKDGVAIIGRNAHWDYALISGQDKDKMIQAAADSLKITFNEAASFGKLAQRDYHALRNQLVELNEDDAVKEIVLVTHTVPRHDLLKISDKFPVHHQMRMGSGLMRNLALYNSYGKVKTWLYGHQHHVLGKGIEKDGITYRQNPRGMPNENNKHYEPAVLTFPTKR